MPLSNEAATRKDKTSGKNAELQHRHFCFIAAVLKANKPIGGPTVGFIMNEQWKSTVVAFASACSDSNPRFDRDRFYAACDL